MSHCILPPQIPNIYFTKPGSKNIFFCYGDSINSEVALRVYLYLTIDEEELTQTPINKVRENLFSIVKGKVINKSTDAQHLNNLKQYQDYFPPYLSIITIEDFPVGSTPGLTFSLTQSEYWQQIMTDFCKEPKYSKISKDFIFTIKEVPILVEGFYMNN